MRRPKGLIPILDEEGIVPRGSWEGFVTKFSKQNNNHPRCKKSRNPLDLVIVHYAGEVVYDPSLFLIKNKDTLSADVVDVLSCSSLPLLHDLFDEELQVKLAAAASGVPEPMSPPTKASSGSDSKMTVGRKFTLQLEQLITNLNSTKPRYIRCIKPNQAKKPMLFVPDLTNEQLTYSGVFEAVIIMQNGYPFRLTLFDFRKKYHMLLCHSRFHAILFDDALMKEYANGQDIGGERMGSSNRKADSKAVRTFSRQQCEEMLRLLIKSADTAASADHKDILRNCHVGVTKVFYQAKQHNFLEKWCQRVQFAAALKLQSLARRNICRKYVPSIIREEVQCSTSILNRHIPELKAACQRIEKLISGLNKAFPYLNFSLDIADVGSGYCSAIEIESHCTKAIETLMSNTKSDYMEKYDQLDSLLNKATSVKFSAVYRGVTYEVDWERNKQLVDFSRQIKDIGIKVRIKRLFDDGIKNEDESALEIAIDALAETRSTRGDDLIDADFCSSEIVAAKRLISAAEDIYAKFVPQVVQAVNAGRLTAKRPVAQSSALIVNVDAQSLTKLIADSIGSPATRSKKVKRMLVMCTCLRDLRLLIMKKNWSDAWVSIQEHWVEFLSAVSKRGDILTSAFFIPSPIKFPLSDEIKATSTAVITNFIVPQMEQSLLSNGVPEVPVWNSAIIPGVVDTRDLENHITVASVYSDYFDEYLKNFLAGAKEHLLMRQAVSSLNTLHYEYIHALVDSIQVVPNDDPDVVNLRKFESMFAIAIELQNEVSNGSIKGFSAGMIDFTQLDVSKLEAALLKATTLKASGNLWNYLLECSCEVKVVRTMLRGDAFDEAAYLSSTSHLERLVAIDLTHTCDGVAGKVLKDLTSTALEEFRTYHREFLHARAVKAIMDALYSGGVTSDIDDRDYTTINASNLISALDTHEPHLIMNNIVTPAWIQDSRSIAQARLLLSKGQWSKLKDLLLPKLASTKGCFDQCHSSCRDELTNAYGRYVDLQLESRLTDALKVGKIISGTVKSDEYAAVDLPTINIKTDALYDAIMDVKPGLNISTITRQLLDDSRYIYCLRSLVRQNAWEPTSILFFGKVPTIDLPSRISKGLQSAKYQSIESVSALITAVIQMDDSLKKENILIERLISSCDVRTLSLAHMVAMEVHSSNPTLREEIQIIMKLTIDRRQQALVLIGSMTCQIRGSIDDVDCSRAQVETLESVIYFLKNSPVVPSTKTSVWKEALDLLLSVRQSMLLHLTFEKSNVDRLLEIISRDALQAMVRKLSQPDYVGFPISEFSLILYKLLDWKSIRSLEVEVMTGAATFEDPTAFDKSSITYSALLELVDEAERNFNKSEHLYRLIRCINQCIQLRMAIHSDNWELSEIFNIYQTAHHHKTALSVKQCLMEFDQLRESFATIIEGVPPLCLVS